MAVEIFSVSNADGAVQRTYGSEIGLASSSDIYLGKGAPGIAYYEKSGPDLRVTLLDGQEVVIRNFFIVGPQGDFSRLLHGPDGDAEVTGMLAPEPMQPDSGVIEPTETAATEETISSDAMNGPSEPVIAEGDADPDSDTAAGFGGGGNGSGGTGGGGIFGLGADQIAFGVTTGSIAFATLSSDDDDDSSGGSPAPTAARLPSEPEETAAAPEQQVEGQPEAPEGTGGGEEDEGGSLLGLLGAVTDLLGLGGTGGDAPGDETGLGGGMFAAQAGETALLGEADGAEPPSGFNILDDLLDTDSSAGA